MKTRRGFAAVAAIAAAALIFSGCALNADEPEPAGAEGGATLRIGTTTDVANFNPLGSLSKTDSWILNAMYPQLMRIDSSGQKVPELAEGYELEDDGATVIFTLRDDYEWTDGEPVTSEDVRFTAQAIIDNQLGNVAAKLTWVQSIETPDDHTVIFRLTEPYAPFAEGVGFWMRVVPAHLFGEVDDLAGFANDSNWVGAGAYVLDSMTRGQRYTMKANENYPYAPEGGAQVETVEYVVYPDVNTMLLALRNGDIDLMGNSVPASAVASLESDPNIEMAEVGALGFAHLTYNMQHPVLAEQPVRQALSMVVDTESIIATILQGDGEQMAGPIGPIFPGFDNPDVEPYAFDPDAARELLEEAGYADADGDGMFDELSFEILCDQSNANLSRVAEVVREDAAAAGINLSLACIERNTFLSRTKNGEYDIDLSQWGVFDNPMDQLRSTYLSSNPGGINYNLVQDAELDALINDAAVTIDQDEFAEKIQAIDEYVHDQALLTPLYVETFRFAYRGDRFEGFDPSPSDLLGMVTGYSLAQVRAL
ncbi:MULTISPECIES: ABC transporter substrate-binding protein [unclassified Microbacterium]|uniref:ABC transporter substrate-binding protein n=1 Tax=unclassified Microbacterium TaxID=2609290 RepID=UPI00214AC4D5|nr:MULTISPECIES: ABC transporter substrate-binding protein [unclassified Microbacterium]MCR2783216.1 ABC transporter substrate-binding protein [Microbacterium sp. zg.B96]MDL5352000.1 ABC transporter substrate-binding protein [Microbacterium sp. zg-YB36]WIM15905.1 ABC transporter substrate-binding protein [Microbacterium sp. zg-B96]